MVAWLLALALSLPHLHGLCTWYDPCYSVEECQVHAMRNSQPFQVDAPTAAVDASLWPAWEGATLVVLTECGRVFVVEATDTGRLYEAGPFERSGAAYPVVLDLPRGFHRRMACGHRPDGNGNTMVVRVWRINAQSRPIATGKD